MDQSLAGQDITLIFCPRLLISNVRMIVWIDRSGLGLSDLFN